VFLLRIGIFRLEFCGENWTYYSVFETADCEQQYSKKSLVIFVTFWAGASSTQNKATAIKIGHIQRLFTKMDIDVMS
jgi:hypothetical protein